MVNIIEVDDLRSTVERIELRSSPRKQLRRLLEESGLIRQLSQPSRPASFAAVDSAFPKSPLYLIGVSISLVAVASLYSNQEGLKRWVRSWLLSEELAEIDQDYVSAYARLRERIEAMRLLQEMAADTLLLDGEIVPRPGKVPLWREVERLSSQLLAQVGRGRCIAGVLKRSYSASIASRLGLNVSDRALASMALRRGEVIIAPHGAEDMRRAGCVEMLYKPRRGIPTAVRVEACCRDPLGLASWLASSAGPSGLPWPIDLVDSLAKQEVGKIYAVEALLLSKLARHELQHLGYTANPQETMRRQRGRER